MSCWRPEAGHQGHQPAARELGSASRRKQRSGQKKGDPSSWGLWHKQVANLLFRECSEATRTGFASPAKPRRQSKRTQRAAAPTCPSPGRGSRYRSEAWSKVPPGWRFPLPSGIHPISRREAVESQCSQAPYLIIGNIYAPAPREWSAKCGQVIQPETPLVTASTIQGRPRALTDSFRNPRQRRHAPFQPRFRLYGLTWWETNAL